MKSLIRRLGSLKLTIGLLVVILLALASGTIVESSRGAEEALRLVYRAPWFVFLLGMFAVNLVCSIVDLYPWGRHRIGYLVSHGSMLLILGGAAVTDLAKVEGVMPILEGEQSSRV